MKTSGYSKDEKLKQKKEISELFERGKWKNSGKVRIISMKSEVNSNPKIGVSVSKRYFKKAVDRNRIKRLLRESYRLNKDIFKVAFGENSVSMLFWVSAEKPHHYSEVEQQFLNLCKPKK